MTWGLIFRVPYAHATKIKRRIFVICSLDALFSAAFWCKIGTWWNATPPKFQRSEDPLNWLGISLKNRTEGLWLQVAIIAVLVSIWKHRNGVIFDKKKIEVDIEFRKSQELAFYWISSMNSKFKMELNKWITNPKNNM